VFSQRKSPRARKWSCPEELPRVDLAQIRILCSRRVPETSESVEIFSQEETLPGSSSGQSTFVFNVKRESFSSVLSPHLQSTSFLILSTRTKLVNFLNCSQNIAQRPDKKKNKDFNLRLSKERVVTPRDMLAQSQFTLSSDLTM